MIKKDITFENLDGVTVTRTYYFHITKADIAKLGLTRGGSMGDYLRKITEENDNEKILEEFERIIGMCVGERTADGEGFRRSAEYRDAFLQSEAYSALFMEFATSPTAFPEFIAGILPRDMRDDFNKTIASTQAEVIQFPGLVQPIPKTTEQFRIPGLGETSEPLVKKPEEYSHMELMDMSDEAFKALLDGIKGNNVPKNILTAAMQRRRP